MTNRTHQRGVALIFVLTTLALVSIVASDFQYESRLNYQLAINARDELQAYNNALSGLRLRALLLKQATRLDGVIRGLMASFGLPANATPPIAQVMQSVPIDCGLLGGLVRLKGGDDGAPPERDRDAEEGGADADADARYTVFMGDCSANILSEHSKTSLVALRGANPAESEKVRLRLIAALSSEAMRVHFEEDDANGQHADNPEELVAALKDFIDDDEDQTGGTSDEDRHYQLLDDAYKAKNAPFDSLDEVQLVYGIDDALWEILRDQLTIYASDAAVQLATASDEQIFWGLLASLAPGVDWLALLNHPGLPLLFEQLAMTRGMWQVVNRGTLTMLLAQAGLQGFFDNSLLNQNFTDTSTPTWFRILATGQAGNVQRRINAVFQAGEGKFYYWREE